MLISVSIGLITISRCEIRLNFRINLQPFSFALPRFKLPPIRISAHFLPSPPSEHDPPPRALSFPGITVTGQNNYPNNLHHHQINQDEEETIYHHQQSTSIIDSDDQVNHNPTVDYNHHPNDYD